jgi:UDP-glucuronate decarboxylase
MSNKTILITGGAGYIGANLCRKLIATGEKVICLDSLNTNRKINIIDLMGNRSFNLLEYNVMNPLIDDFLFNIQIDEIYNLANSAGPVTDYGVESAAGVKKSIIGTFNLLELARRSKSKVLHACVAETYEDFMIKPDVSNNKSFVNCCIGPRACHDEKNAYTESIFFDYHRQYRLPVKVVHLYNTYGPHVHPQDGRIISNLIVQALLNTDIILYGNGNQSRSFCYVDDLTDGLLKMMNTPEEVIGPIQLGNPAEYSILDLAELIIRLAHSKSKLIYKALPIDEPLKTKPDISSARKILGWEPATAHEEGLRKTIRYFRTLLNGETFTRELDEVIA